MSSPVAIVGRMLAVMLALSVVARTENRRPKLTCAVVVERLKGQAENVTCAEREDITTRDERTTPGDDPDPALPKGALRPQFEQLDWESVAEETSAVPGIQIHGSLGGNEQSRWLLRIPANWNHRLVVAIPGGLDSEYSFDHAWSDYLLRRGFAYASNNKGSYNFRFTDPQHDPQACPLAPEPSPLSKVYVHLFVHDDADALKHWLAVAVKTTTLAKRVLAAEHKVEFTYLVGVSAGAWVVRLALERAPEGFDGGLDWEGVYFSLDGPNPAIYLPRVLRDYRQYQQGGPAPGSAAAAAFLQDGFPPEVRSGPTRSSASGSLWETTANETWTRLACAMVFAIDAGYRGALSEYDYRQRRSEGKISSEASQVVTSGEIRRRLISLQGTMDSVVPIQLSGRPYRERVVRAGRGKLHRFYEIQNGNHQDKWTRAPYDFQSLEPILPRAYEAFQLLTRWVEAGQSPPVGHCVPRRQRIQDATPQTEEHCSRLLAP